MSHELFSRIRLTGVFLLEHSFAVVTTAPAVPLDTKKEWGGVVVLVLDGVLRVAGPPRRRDRAGTADGVARGTGDVRRLLLDARRPRRGVSVAMKKFPLVAKSESPVLAR